MNFDASIQAYDLRRLPKLVHAAEAIGFDALWSHETQHDPFLPLAVISEHRKQLSFGTAVAIAFARSPTTVAHSAWDLARASGGNFILGLGTQVRTHIQHRFGLPWPESPVGQLREYILALRALWRTWQTGERLNFRGKHYKLTVMTPFFNPGPIENPYIPIYIAGVNTGLCCLAGELADGFIAHPYHSERYLREVIKPAIEEGASRAGRDASRIVISTSAMTISSLKEKALIQAQIAFYASTPTYRPVMALHGWGEIADQLQTLSRKKAWDEMPSLIDDEMLDTFALSAPSGQLGSALLDKYHGLVDRLTLYRPFIPGEQDDCWKQLAETLHEE